jgi:NADH-quinone oxidoreductase subunit I
MNSPVKEYFRGIYLGLKTTFVGMGITLDRMFKPGITLQYPTEKRQPYPRYRGMLFNDIDDCIVCRQCSTDCPVDCIHIEGEKAGKEEDLGVTTGGSKKKIKLLRFDIDLNHCLYCGLCTEVCPTECLVMTDGYEHPVETREGLYLRFAHPEEYAPKAPPVSSAPGGTG